MHDQNHAISERSSDTQRSAWSDAEKARLLELAPKKLRRSDIALAFPNRTVGAVRTRLNETRRKLGLAHPVANPLAGREVEPTMLDRDDPGLEAPSWQDRQRPKLKRANAAYLAALGIAA